MVNQSYLEKENQVLWQAREGMRVYASDNDYVGRIRYIQFPSEMAEEAQAMAGKQLAHIPEDIRKRLLREGFAQVGGGLFSPDYYIPSSQISAISSEGMVLNELKADLVRF